MITTIAEDAVDDGHLLLRARTRVFMRRTSTPVA